MIFDSLLGLFSPDMGIDLGTCNTLVCVRGQGVVLNEPSVVAVKRGTNRVLQNGNAVGLVAKEMLGKTPGSISAIRPMKDGVIADFDITEAMLRYFIRKAHRRRGPIKPRVVIAGVPSLTPLVIQFELVSKGMELRLTTIPTRSRAFWASFPVTLIGVKSTRTM